MITVSGLCKSYSGTSFAVRGVSFEVERGEVVGFLGPNGAGKTTTLRVVAGFLGATAGRVTLAGHDLELAPVAARRQVGYMPEAVPLYPEMRVREYLRFRAQLKKVARRERASAVGKAMERARVTDVADQLIGHLSKGYRQRVGLADALVASPPILLLDEPTAGLDPNQIREVRALLSELRRDHAILLSTHILSEVEATCDRALVISGGALVAQGTLEQLSKLREARSVRLTVGQRDGLAEAVAKVPGVERCEEDGAALLVTWAASVEDPGAACEALARAVVSLGFGLRELRPVKASLEQVFADLTEGSRA